MSTFGDLKVSTINGGPTGAKNAIINGNFGINQRGVSGTVTLSAGVYGHDRWKAGASGCTYTFATSNNVTTIDISAGSLIQVIEGINLESGTYTLSWTGTAQGKIGAGSFGNSGITGTSTGGTNLEIEFGTGTVSLVQFELGTVATPFERRQFGQELALCQRYFQKVDHLTGNGGIADNWFLANIGFLVQMRTPPSLVAATVYASDSGSARTLQSGSAVSGWTLHNSSPTQATIRGANTNLWQQLDGRGWFQSEL
jgi:hypothetical protein